MQDHNRSKRLMMFTSLLRTLNFVSHARVLQCYDLFLKFELEYPLIDGYTLPTRVVDHNNMRMFISKLGEVNEF